MQNLECRRQKYAAFGILHSALCIPAAWFSGRILPLDMFRRTVSPEDLARFKKEREEADRLYNDALTILDRAILRMPQMPHAPPAPDESRLAALSELSTHSVDVKEPFWRAWLRRFIADVVGPALDRQRSFNTTLVDHLNSSVAAQRATNEAIENTIVVLRDAFEALVSFQSRLIMYAQQITPYVDTKNREVAGLARRINEDNAEAASGLAAGLDALTEAHQVTREAVAILQRTSMVLKRKLEQMAPGGAARASGAPRVAAADQADLDAYKYVGFEDAFRGTREEIRIRQESYTPFFAGATDVVDIGCGRGEFLELLREGGIRARGIDVNPEMVETCRQRGLEVTQADALAFLDSAPDESLGGLFAAQVVEHLPAGYLMRLLEVAGRKLRPGAAIIIETINPACWAAFFSAYIRDITHRHPIHPETLRYLLQASGFTNIDILYRSPHPDAAKLQAVTVNGGRAEGTEIEPLARLTAAFNANVDRLNQLLFGHHDYAAVARRP